MPTLLYEMSPFDTMLNAKSHPLVGGEPSCVTLPRIAVSVGCAHGVGPEIVTKLAYQHVMHPSAASILRLYGDLDACNAMAALLHYPSLQQLVHDSAGRLELHPTALPQELAGRSSFRAVEEAVQAIASGECHGLVTAPVSKASWRAAGIPYSGHTEALEALANRYWPDQETPYQADMLFRFQQFTLLLLTRHVPLCHVSQHLTFNTAFASIKNLMEYTMPQGSAPVKSSPTFNIALLGVNPHAHEIGGEEERMVLEPLRQAVQTHWPHVTVTPPLPADAFFRGFDAMYAKGFNAVVSPYHDQGLIPMKLLGGYGAVNITIGLPFSRTSVSHGTGEDIAGQGIANPEGLFNALNYLLEQFRTRIHRC